MKYIAALVAALMLIGSAAAWTDSDKATYSYQKYATVQDGIIPFDHVYSGTFFFQNMDPSNPPATFPDDPYGDVSGIVVNQALRPVITGGMGDTEQLLTQAGTVSANLMALNSQDCKPEVKLAMDKSQDYWFSGVAKSVSIQLEDFGFVGAAGESNGALPNGLFLKEATNFIDNTAGYTGKVDALGTSKLSEVFIGQDTASGLTADLYTGVLAMSGSSAAYAGFENAMVAPGWNNRIVTDANSETGHGVVTVAPIDLSDIWEDTDAITSIIPNMYPSY